MSRKSRQIQHANPVIECPLDLDGLILSSCGGMPDFLNANLNVSEDILFDAISMSAYAGWLLNLEVFGRLSLDVRTSLLRVLNVFSSFEQTCFLVKATSLPGSSSIRLEVERFLERNPSTFSRDALGLFNPLSRLNNPTRSIDLSILSGETFLRKAFYEQVEKFVKSKDKSDIDFSSSVFLPEILNPRFSMMLDEGERLVVLGMCGKYFETVSSFARGTWGMSSMCSARSRKTNLPQALLKWVLTSDDCTLRTKLMAYRQVLKEIERMRSKSGILNHVIIGQVLDVGKTQELYNREQNELNKKEISTTSLMEWMNSSEGLFESFELDCTLHNLDATMFWPEILHYPDTHMAEGMMDFQDDDIKLRLLKEIGDSMTAFR